MKVITRATVLALILAGAVLAPAQAAADPAKVYDKVARAPNPQAAAAALNKDERKALIDYLTPVETTITPLKTSTKIARSTLSSGCREVGHAVGRQNGLGVLLWTWNMYAEVCWNGATITYSYVRSSGITYVLFWSWSSLGQSKAINPYSIPVKLTAFSQAEFKLCLFGDIGCTNYIYPWIELRFWADGSWAWRGQA